MPAPTPFLSHSRVLGAANRHTQRFLCITNVTADALANVVESAFINLARQERIGNRGPRRTDHILGAAIDLAQHGVGRGETPDADHRLAGQRFQLRNCRLLRSFFHKSRASHFEMIITDGDIPQVR